MWLPVVDEADFLFLLEEAVLTRGNVSSHVARLEGAGYGGGEKTFVAGMPRSLYRLGPVHLRKRNRDEHSDYRRP